MRPALSMNPFAPTDGHFQRSNFVSEHSLLNSFVKSAVIRTSPVSRFMKKHATPVWVVNTISWISFHLTLRSFECVIGHSVTTSRPRW